jgi:hypothetical protein
MNDDILSSIANLLCGMDMDDMTHIELKIAKLLIDRRLLKINCDYDERVIEKNN